MLGHEQPARQSGTKERPGIVRQPAGNRGSAREATPVAAKEGRESRRHSQHGGGQSSNALEGSGKRAVEGRNGAPLARQGEWRERGGFDHGFADHCQED